MKKNLTLSLVLGIAISSCAMFSSDNDDNAKIPAPAATPDPTLSCTATIQEAKGYSAQIKAGFASKESCAIGEAQIKRYNLIQSNLGCFPGYPKGEYILFKVLDQLDTSIEPVTPQCASPRAKAIANNQRIKTTLMQNDGCKAGAAELDTFSIIQQNPLCFESQERSIDNLITAITAYRNDQVAAQQAK